jgi:glycosyltransferase involved in cell wall biosynthesis
VSGTLVTVIVPAFDAEPFIGAALDSALAQDHPAVEIVVVDDGSTDATAEIAAGREGVRVLRRPHGGPAAARNAGLAAARGEFVTVLDADDLWPADRLSRQVGHLAAHPELDLVLGLTEVFLSPGEARPAHYPDVPGGRPLRAVAGTMLARRSAFDAIGGWDEDLPVSEDTDWLARAKDAGLRAETLEHVVLRYRIHARNTSRHTAANHAALLRVLRDSVKRRREPLVSAVIPVHRGERFLPAALDSVAAQTHPNVETIVVDDGSPDASADLAEGRPGVTVLRRPRGGVAAARNAGIAVARGEFIALLDQDDEWLPDRLARQLAALREHPAADVALCHMHMALASGTEQPEWFPDAWLEAPQPGWVPSAWLVRRRAFDAVGPFDETLEIACDADWLARLKDAGGTSVMLDDVLVRWVVHGANGSYDRETMLRELMGVMRRTAARQREAARAS